MTTAIIRQGITLEYEESGPRHGPPVLLIMGLGCQLSFWPEAFCAGLSAHGYRVIRFDNRDIGLSTKFAGSKQQSLGKAMLAALLGLPVRAPYTLVDMAQDSAALLDVLQIPTAHVIGVSMGGMISQTLAACYPSRVLSLTSLMSGSGDRRLSKPRFKALRRLLKRPPRSGREAQIRFTVETLKNIGSPAYPFPERELRDLVTRNYDRSYYPSGIQRQLLAILASGSRVDLLRTINAPALVIHGSADPLVPLAAGRDTAAHIPQATLKIIDGMGHDLPPSLIPVLLDMITQHVDETEAVSSPPTVSGA